jgi:hypothetical protein
MKITLKKIGEWAAICFGAFIDRHGHDMSVEQEKKLRAKVGKVIDANKAEKEDQWKQEAHGQTNDRVKIKVIKEGPGRIGATIDACCKDPSQTVFAQALLDKALEDYFLIQLAMLANTKVNAYVTISRWKNAGLKLPTEGTPEFYP